MYKWLSIVFFLLFSSYAIAQKTPRKQALLVGVSDYKGDRYDLPGIDQDIKKMKKLFMTWGFAEKDIKIVSGKDSLNLRRYLQDYGSGPNKLVEGDIFAFYFSGHGSSVADQGKRDEQDFKDETLVLSNGYTNTHFLDDELDYYLSRIKARKIELFDSCHSGTVNKGGGGTKGVQKTMPSGEARIVYQQKMHSTPKKAGKTGKSVDTVTFSASKDAEKSLSTDNGSPFTNEFYIQFSSRFNQQRSLKSVHDDISYNIITYCRKHGENDYHPQLSSSNKLLKKKSLAEYLRISQ